MCNSAYLDDTKMEVQQTYIFCALPKFACLVQRQESCSVCVRGENGVQYAPRKAQQK